MLTTTRRQRARLGVRNTWITHVMHDRALRNVRQVRLHLHHTEVTQVFSNFRGDRHDVRRRFERVQQLLPVINGHTDIRDRHHVAQRSSGSRRENSTDRRSL